jgi:hypothetical protein
MQHFGVSENTPEELKEARACTDPGYTPPGGFGSTGG